MTFSLVARCPFSGQFGIGACTAMPGVGKLLTHAAPRVGAVATQATLNPYIGLDGVELLREGLTAPDVRDRLIEKDPSPERRQFAIVDRMGGVAHWTGERNLPWAGARTGNGFVATGNRLAGADVLEAAAAAFEKDKAETALSQRLMAALRAGVAAGGDRNGERSATIYVVHREDYPLWDLRVDEHDDPVAELERLYEVYCREFMPFMARLPTRANPAGKDDEADV